MGMLKDKYAELKKNNNKQIYDGCAKVIVGFKIAKHLIFTLPKAREKMEMDKEVDNKSSLYKNESVLDYLEEPGFEWKEEVERISDKIEQKMDSVNDKMTKFREKTSVFYWIKTLISKIKNRNIKMLQEGRSEELPIEENNRTQEKRIKFIGELKNISKNEETQECYQSEKNLNENDYER